MLKVIKVLMFLIVLMLVPLSCYAIEYKVVYPIGDNSTSYELPSTIQDFSKEDLHGFVYKGHDKSLYLTSMFIIIDEVSDNSPNNLEEYDKTALSVFAESRPFMASKSDLVVLKNCETHFSIINGELAVLKSYEERFAKKPELTFYKSMEIMFLKNGKWYIFAYKIEIGKMILALNKKLMKREEFDKVIQELTDVLKHSVNSIRIDSIFAQ